MFSDDTMWLQKPLTQKTGIVVGTDVIRLRWRVSPPRRTWELDATQHHAPPSTLCGSRPRACVRARAHRSHHWHRRTCPGVNCYGQKTRFDKLLRPHKYLSSLGRQDIEGWIYQRTLSLQTKKKNLPLVEQFMGGAALAISPVATRGR